MEGSQLSKRKGSCTMWHGDRVTFCVPERLSELLSSNHGVIAGIILLDPNCILHHGRSFGAGKCRVVHDSSQLIVDFKAKLAIGRWSPPLMIMAIHKAAAVATDSVARIYGLDAMHFIEGSSLRCGETGCLVSQKNSDISGRIFILPDARDSASCCSRDRRQRRLQSYRGISHTTVEDC